MTNIELVIKIPKELYEKCKRMGDTRDTLYESIRNGIILPEMHGKLIDADALVDSLGSSDRDIYCKGVIEEEAQTIIEADNAESEDE